MLKIVEILFYVVTLTLLKRVPGEKAVLNYADGSIYTGDVVDDVREGYGEMRFDNGDVYSGEWKNDTMTGQGKLKYHEGNIYKYDEYDEQMINGRRSGYGTMIWSNGEKYIGEWRKCEMHGKHMCKF